MKVGIDRWFSGVNLGFSIIFAVIFAVIVKMNYSLPSFNLSVISTGTVVLCFLLFNISYDLRVRVRELENEMEIVKISLEADAKHIGELISKFQKKSR
jgi:hypothetical protein